MISEHIININDLIFDIQSLIRDNSKHLPFPLAIVSQNIEYYCNQFIKTGFSSRHLLLKGLIDFIEVYAKFVSIVYLSECREIYSTSNNKEVFTDIKQALIYSKLGRGKISYSLGDWLGIAEIAAKSLSRFTNQMVFPELLGLVLSSKKKRITQNSAFASARNRIVSIRNRMAHGYITEVVDNNSDSNNDIKETLACMALLIKAANTYFKDFSFVIPFYLNKRNKIYSWNIHGIEIKEIFSSGDIDLCDKLIRLESNEKSLILSPFSYYTTGALSLEYYYLMDSIFTKSGVTIDDIDYLGIGHLKSNRYRLKSSDQSQFLLRQFSEFLGIQQETPKNRVEYFAENLQVELENNIKRTIDRPDVRSSLLYLLEKAKILFVMAPPGAGKTVFASWWAFRENHLIFFNRYSANSDPITQMYRYFYLQISNKLGIPIEDTNDPNRVKVIFNSLQHKYIVEKNLMVLIYDGFDELPEEYYPEFFSFLRGLPSLARIIIFSRPIPKELITETIQLANLPLMTAKEIGNIPEIKELNLEINLLKNIFEFSGGNPLISIFAAREILTNGMGLNKNLKEIYLGLYSKMVINDEKDIICLIFSVLINSSRTLQFDELHELLVNHLDITNFSKLSISFKKVSRFITIGVDGGCSIFHKSFADAILSEISDEITRKVHFGLALFFEKNHQILDKSFIPHHLLKSGQLDLFIEKMKILPKHFIDYFLSHAQTMSSLSYPKFINNDLDIIFYKMLEIENPDIKLVVAQILYYFGFWRDAEYLYESVYASIDDQANKNSIDKLSLSIILGALYKNLDKWEKARSIIEKSILDITASNELSISPIILSKYTKEKLKYLCRLYHNLASILYDSGTNRKESVKMFNLSRAMAVKAEDEICKLASDIGNLCYLIESASYKEAKNLIKDLSSSFKKYPVEELYFRLNHTAYCLRADTLSDMHEIFDFNINDIETMQLYLTGLQNRQISAYFFNNIGIYYYMNGKIESSLGFIKKCIEISKDIEDFCMLSGSLINLGIITKDVKKFEEAELIAKKIGDDEEIAACRHNRDALNGNMEHKIWLQSFYEEINDLDGNLMIGKVRPWFMTQFIDLFL